MPDTSLRNPIISAAWAPPLARIGAVALAATIVVTAAGDAAACDIDRAGPRAYQRVIEQVPRKLSKVEQFNFEPYEDVQISAGPDCVLDLRGRFTFKNQRNLESRVYDARLTPRAGAPHGMKILKLRISAP